MANLPKKQKRSSQSIFQTVANLLAQKGEREIHVRFMCASDLDQVVKIDEQCFGYESWSEGMLLNNLTKQRCVVKVAVRDDEIVGFVAYKPATEHIRILRLAVSPFAWRTKIGTSLVEDLQKKMREKENIRSVSADVPDDCLPVQLLLRNVGFRAVEILKNREKELYRMTYSKNSGEPYHAPLVDARRNPSGSD